VSKLEARKELATFSMPEDGAGVREGTNDDDSLFETSILQQIWDVMEEREIEIIQIRGLSGSDKKYAHAAAEHLCYEMEEYYYATVVMGGNDDHDDDDDNQEDEEEEEEEVDVWRREKSRCFPAKAIRPSSIVLPCWNWIIPTRSSCGEALDKRIPGSRAKRRHETIGGRSFPSN
jgi:hypothetical protein